MKISLLSIAVLLCLSSIHAESQDQQQDAYLASIMANPKFKPNTLGNVIPGRFIIEFEQDYRGSSLEFVNDIESEIDISPRIKMNIAQDYSSSPSLFRGVSISIDQPSSTLQKRSEQEQELHMQSIHNTVLRKILEQNRVKHIYPVTEIPRPNVQQMSPTIDAYAIDQDSQIIPGAPTLELPDNGLPLPFSHAMTQVDKVHDKYKGNGVLVGIIDSGIDYRHPAFGSGFGPGYQVRFGYDLVGNQFNSRDPLSRKQQETPLDTCLDGNGHGTHVAGIIAANDKMFNFTGVAPEVTLGAWRIFGCDGATSNDLVIQALISAHEAGCDIINLSLGSSSNWADDPTAIIANRVAERGSIVIAAAGNDGFEGAFFISSPASGTGSVAVASMDNEYNLQQAVQADNGAEYPYLLSSTTKEFPSGKLVNYINSESAEDACPGTRPNNSLKDKIVLVQRGKCTFDEKADMVEQYGGAGIVVYDNQEEPGFKPQTLTSKLPLASISMSAGKELKQRLNTNTTLATEGIQLTFKTALAPQKVPTARKVSKFSSVGPLYDMSLKPDLGGPGGYIFSTLPIPNGGYGLLSGTSMAAPYIAGAYALFLEAHGKNVTAQYLKEHFQNYAKPSTTTHGIYLDNPARQGAGLIQLLDTIHQSVHVSPGSLSFNDTANIKPQTLKITNPSNRSVTYSVSHHPSLAISPYNTTLQGFAPLNPPQYAAEKVKADIELSFTHVTLRPGQSANLNLTVKRIGGNHVDQPYPIYGGFVEFSPVNNSALRSIHVPYVGIRGSLAELPIFDNGFPRLLLTNSTLLFEKEVGNGKTIVGFVIERSSFLSSFVTSTFRLLTGTSYIVTEVLDANMTEIGVFSEDSYLSRNTLQEQDFIFTQRWNGTVIPTGSDSNVVEAEAVKPGLYFLRWKALKLMSDASRPESWFTKVSPPILIRN
ncbi:S-adenosylmethionine transporter [Mucor velutinosus]|uniref:S-adenosylmethionine transporter n=1 Tax=Mucor velutinosus TaxID=708070 RepID=A0AAN7DKM3_9FUNG|nr:S-adenosylmethionine transporter [Mucor velutinosus]